MSAEELAELEGKREESQREAALAAHRLRLVNALVPKRHAEIINTIADQAEGPWLERFETLRSRLGEGFLVGIVGSRGTGKTQLGVGLINARCLRGFECRYIKLLDLFRVIRSCFREGGPDEVQMVKQFTGYALLVIDEAHERGHTDFERRTLTNILDHRYDAKLDTILLSNETAEAFAASVGPSVVSRINEVGEVIECNWPSFRDAPKCLQL